MLFLASKIKYKESRQIPFIDMNVINVGTHSQRKFSNVIFLRGLTWGLLGIRLEPLENFEEWGLGQKDNEDAWNPGCNVTDVLGLINLEHGWCPFLFFCYKWRQYIETHNLPFHCFEYRWGMGHFSMGFLVRSEQMAHPKQAFLDEAWTLPKR